MLELKYFSIMMWWKTKEKNSDTSTNGQKEKGI